MADWAQNVVTFAHCDTKQVERLVRAFNDGALLQEFVPIPLRPGQTAATWAECRAAWGVKWEVSSDDIAVYEPGSTEVTVRFESANDIPHLFFACMREENWTVTARWWWPHQFSGDEIECGRDDATGTETTRTFMHVGSVEDVDLALCEANKTEDEF